MVAPAGHHKSVSSLCCQDMALQVEGAIQQLQVLQYCAGFRAYFMYSMTPWQPLAASRISCTAL